MSTSRLQRVFKACSQEKKCSLWVGATSPTSFWKYLCLCERYTRLREASQICTYRLKETFYHSHPKKKVNSIELNARLKLSENACVYYWISDEITAVLISLVNSTRRVIPNCCIKRKGLTVSWVQSENANALHVLLWEDIHPMSQITCSNVPLADSTKGQYSKLLAKKEVQLCELNTFITEVTSVVLMCGLQWKPQAIQISTWRF